TELEIPIISSNGKMTPKDVEILAHDFHQASLFRYKTNDPDSMVEFIMWRHMATHMTPRIELEISRADGQSPSAALMGKQKAYFGPQAGFEETLYYDGEKLHHGRVIVGPAIVVLNDTTIVVPPDFTLAKQVYGYFIMDVPV
ncbi:MAG: hypothetical protein HQK55_17160, partial [Deltaproteobacteria bacterium]|nr:hypothetical protein [Deltaproteobacteria bacterium]